MSSVLGVAKYILNRQGSMTAMKLEKLAYYCQAWSLAWDGVPLFKEDFQAWANGPVCPELFHVHKGSFTVDKNLIPGDPSFSDTEIETMNSVLDYYGDKAPHWLSELTHKEMPWKEARKGVPDGYPCSNIITKQSMQEYYSGLE